MTSKTREANTLPAEIEDKDTSSSQSFVHSVGLFPMESQPPPPPPPPPPADDLIKKKDLLKNETSQGMPSNGQTGVGRVQMSGGLLSNGSMSGLGGGLPSNGQTNGGSRTSEDSPSSGQTSGGLPKVGQTREGLTQNGRLPSSGRLQAGGLQTSGGLTTSGVLQANGDLQTSGGLPSSGGLVMSGRGSSELPNEGFATPGVVKDLVNEPAPTPLGLGLVSAPLPIDVAHELANGPLSLDDADERAVDYGRLPVVDDGRGLDSKLAPMNDDEERAFEYGLSHVDAGRGFINGTPPVGEGRGLGNKLAPVHDHDDERVLEYALSHVNAGRESVNGIPLARDREEEIQPEIVDKKVHLYGLEQSNPLELDSDDDARTLKVKMHLSGLHAYDKKFQDDDTSSDDSISPDKADFDNDDDVVAKALLHQNKFEEKAEEKAEEPPPISQGAFSELRDPTNIKGEIREEAFGRKVVLNAVLSKAPKIRSVSLDHTIEKLVLGHFNFIITLEHEGFIWRVRMHRQQLIEFHANLKTVRLFHPLTAFWHGRVRKSSEAAASPAPVTKDASCWASFWPERRGMTGINTSLMRTKSFEENHEVITPTSGRSNSSGAGGHHPHRAANAASSAERHAFSEGTAEKNLAAAASVLPGGNVGRHLPSQISSWHLGLSTRTGNQPSKPETFEELSLERAIKHIHFPRSLLPGRHFRNPTKSKSGRHGSNKASMPLAAMLPTIAEEFFNNELSNYAESSVVREHVESEVNSIAQTVIAAVRKYLECILANPKVRNLPIVLDLLRCSALSFDQSLGPSLMEGWVGVKKLEAHEAEPHWHKARMMCCMCNLAFVKWRFLRRNGYWVVIKRSFIAFLRNPADAQPDHVLLFDSGFDVRKSFSATGRQKNIIVGSNSWMADLRFSSRVEKMVWSKAFASIEDDPHAVHLKEDNPFNGFVPERTTDCQARVLIDGKEYFRAVLEAIDRAKNEILIGGWWITPNMLFRRFGLDAAEEQADALTERHEDTLLAVLKNKAHEGCKVYIFMYQDVSIAMSLFSRFQDLQFANEPNIFVLRHPRPTHLTYWSHHEKLVVCDRADAFVGGIDLAWGRYDDCHHFLVDENSSKWPGIDYYNPRIQDICSPHNYGQDLLERTKEPRMPWHDVSCHLVGSAVRDVARCFVHQWNNGVETKSGSRSDLPLLLPLDVRVQSECILPPGASGFHPTKCQILRSLPQWSGGSLEGESSIQEAYLDAISNADRFIYLENQFFISRTTSNDKQISNRIADALFSRIMRAAREGRPFKVIIVLPLLPGFEGQISGDRRRSASSLRNVMYWQYRTICRGDGRSLWERLKSAAPTVRDPNDYLSFLSLRAFDSSVTTSNAPEKTFAFTEMIYVHSKIMIVDDVTCIIGSANVNDRSMTGERDSELAVRITDTDFYQNAFLAGESWSKSGKFCRDFRMRLFREHFGQDVSESILLDFVKDENFNALKDLAKSNTEIFERVFACLPSDTVKTFQELRKRTVPSGFSEEDFDEFAEDPEHAKNLIKKSRKGKLMIGEPTPTASSAITAGETALISGAQQPGQLNQQPAHPKLQKLRSFETLTENAEDWNEVRAKRILLGNIRGHVVEFPLEFLANEPKLKGAIGVFIDDTVYT